MLPGSPSGHSEQKSDHQFAVAVSASSPGSQTKLSETVHCFHILTKTPTSLPAAGSKKKKNQKDSNFKNFVLKSNHWDQKNDLIQFLMK